MRIQVCSQVSIPATGQTLPDWQPLRNAGHAVVVSNNLLPVEPPDVIIGMGVGVMEHTFNATDLYLDVPFFAYNWDCYEWVWKNPRPGEYDYNRYGELLKRAKEIWVPSDCTGKRTTQWWELTNWETVCCSVPYWDHPNVRDSGYALCCLREIPDPYWGRFEKACTELGIPYRMTAHGLRYEQYQDSVAHCRFICSPLYELSTGGLSTLEAFYLGKPVILSNSPWHGGRDYFREKATYFNHESEEDFRRVLQAVYDNPESYVPRDHKEFITENFSDEVTCRNILKRIEYHLS